ncbi:MAG TPA: enoyl-CoA hydratase/isomerase family protein [Caulobacteraceae bacterium]|nr:enoyl-CoA hydratase/isomerase family protein [Caulobacteraceae bacterium]
MSQAATLQSEVFVSRDGALGRLTLNRPAALGALTTGMCEAMIAALIDWRSDPTLHAVLIDHAGDRGFSAGGDIRTLAESAAGDGLAARRFFFVEYQLDHLIHSYPKPVITVMDGVTMGGGVGISWTASRRVVTERTTFAMPETGIGLFPDVGAGWFLPRLPGRAGLWLALTGARLKAADCLALTLATHYVPAADLTDLKQTLAADAEQPTEVLATFAAEPGPPPIAALRRDIDRLFDHQRVEDVVEALTADGSDWALAQARTIATKSPTSLKVAARLIRDGAAMPTFADDMVMEHRIACRLGLGRDFLEGVRAVIIDKDNAPRWDPATLEDVTDAAIDDIFAPLPPGQEWSPLP